jgi:hypothetical protein
MRRIAVSVAIAVTALAATASAATATTYTVSGPVTVADNPFPLNCGGPGESGGAVVYRDAEVEPWLDVNPANSLNMVAFWQQDRWADGGSHGLAVGVTKDGGTTWTTPAPPKFSRCAGGTMTNGGYYERASDPWLSFASDGTLHAISISFDRSTSRNAVLVSRSTDGGDSWSNPITLRFDESNSGPLANLFNDKESITADPDNSHVYAVWDRIESPAGNPKLPPPSYENSLAWHGPTWFARSTNGGVSWEQAREIFAPKASRTQTIGNQIVVLPNGDLLDGFNYLYYSKGGVVNGGDHVTVIRSTDKGDHWSGPIPVAPFSERGVRDPEPVAQCRPDMAEDELCTLVRTGDIIPDFAVDRNPASPFYGNVYAVWQEHHSATAGGRPVDDSIMVSRSTDGGFTWSEHPVRVNHTPSNAYNKQAFTAAVDVAPNGDVAVTYYDFRNDAEGDARLTTDYWIVHSHDGGLTFPDESQLTPTTGFDMRKAPYARGYFVGDYQGLAHSGNLFRSFFDVGVDSASNSDPGSNHSDNVFASAG